MMLSVLFLTNGILCLTYFFSYFLISALMVISSIVLLTGYVICTKVQYKIYFEEVLDTNAVMCKLVFLLILQTYSGTNWLVMFVRKCFNRNFKEYFDSNDIKNARIYELIFSKMSR